MRNIKNHFSPLIAIAVFALFVMGCKATIKKDTTSSKPIPQRYHSCIAAFYNFENFYDTINNTTIDDEEFLPTGAKHYSSSIYNKKVSNLATVVQKIGADINNDGPAILGAVEIENDTVLQDLIKHPLLKNLFFSSFYFKILYSGDKSKMPMALWTRSRVLRFRSILYFINFLVLEVS